MEALLPRLDADARRILLAYGVHRFARGEAASPACAREAARHLAARTGEPWTAERVLAGDEQVRRLIAAHAPEEAGRSDGALAQYVVAILTLRLLSDGDRSE